MRKTNVLPELIKEAKKMYETGCYSTTSIAKYLGFSTRSLLEYHINEKSKETQLKATRRWQTNNRERHLRKMKEYSRKYYAKNKGARKQKSTT